MAAGDFILFDDAMTDLANKVHNLASDTIKLAFITTATTPTASTAGPHFGGTGTTDLSTNQTSGGNVAAGGVTLDSLTSTQTSGTYTFDSANETIAAHASNPAAARWGIVYNDTDVNKRCLGFLDLGAASDMTAGAVITVASGWFTATH